MSSTPNPFALNLMDSTSAFIDGPSLYWAYKSLDTEQQIDMMKLKGLIEDNSRLQNISYYTVFPPSERREDGYSTPLKPLTDFLGYNGFRVFTKEAMTYSTDLGSRTKGSITLDMALDAYSDAANGINHILLFASDGDYVPLVTALQSKGSRVTLVSTTEKHVVSDDLVWLADSFVDLKNVADFIGRDRRD